MNFLTVKLIIGAVFMLIALVGKLEIKGVSTGISNKYIRFGSLVLGLLIIVLNPNNLNFSNPLNSEIKKTDWVGNWRTGWRYSSHFNNPIKEETITFRVEEDLLVGTYKSTDEGRPVKTTLTFSNIKDNQISGSYRGYYTDDYSIYETGEIELLLVKDKKFFIGRYMRTKPNKWAVDGNFRLWYGTKISNN